MEEEAEWRVFDIFKGILHTSWVLARSGRTSVTPNHILMEIGNYIWYQCYNRIMILPLITGALQIFSPPPDWLMLDCPLLPCFPLL